MQVTVLRFASDDDTTISLCQIDGVFECFGIEDEYRSQKVMHETRIPAGKYKIGVRTHGKFHEKYKALYPWHKGMLEILGVPRFTDVLIHIGNDDDDTSGCYLIGEGCYAKRGNMSVQNSRGAYEKFYNKVIDAALAGNLYIEFVDKDRP